MPNGTEYVKLEKRLVLLAWLNSLLGYKSNQELLSDAKQPAEGTEEHGFSHLYLHLIARGGKVKISQDELGGYDGNIRDHLAAINARRPEPVTLRYFQHLALLYTEIFLHWRFNRPGSLLQELNAFARDRNARKRWEDPADPEFTESDLNKLAFWMATGSGKTLIMHVNYLQFLHYNKRPLDNVLLITPNEGLTEQHLAEMAMSSIPCDRFNLDESGLGLGQANTVRVIEITKLVEQKRGGGVSVPVEAFEGNNLVFVDEGHKGAGGEAWRKFRDALGQTGFTFEYSATFGQALSAAGNDELTAEYGRAIAFDYSYKYFYGDGYGKDFHILNLRDETTDEATETLLLGNLLNFYEQQRCFREQTEQLRPYNLEKPLWVFVGSRVNAVYTEARQKRSDVLTIARFLQHFLANEGDWAVKTVKRIIDGSTGLIDGDGKDIFSGKFEYLRGAGADPSVIYRDILAKVFRAPAGGALHLCDIRSGPGELGLKASTSEEYFGLIYIGDTTAFKKLVEADGSGIVQETDAISDSLFGGINTPGTSINVLIGAKKFMEGWNSWRVSNMGLMNIGRSEGSEIIQLFGRGVRLRGKDFSLKRSSALAPPHPPHIKLLETLSIFAVRANYMAQFRDYLEREGVETEGHIELPLAIKANQGFLDKGLLVPRVPAGRNFAAECDILLAPDAAASVTVDMSLKVESMRSQQGGVATVAMAAGQAQTIQADSLAMIDWEGVYLDLLEYKRQKGFTNLVIRPDVPLKVLKAESPRLYKLLADQAVVSPRSLAEVPILREAVMSILRKYVEKFYRVCQERWDSNNMAYAVLDKADPNFQDYVVRIARSEAQLIAAVKQLIDEANRIYAAETCDLPNIHFHRHLYQPLLVERGDRISSDPPGLKKSEVDFVRNMRDYVRREAAASLADKEVFLLRNLGQGKGIGFFADAGFYPDFILWIKDDGRQRIVFIEPHGMLMEKAYEADDKARLHERLPSLSETWAAKAGLKGVSLDSFIISATPYDELRPRYDTGNWTIEQFAEKHILFFERQAEYDYVQIIICSG